MPTPEDLYTAPAIEVDYELVKSFVLNVEAANLFSESLTFEAKQKRDKNNIAEAVAALGNTDSGVVLVGIKDKDATGEDRIVGVPKAEHDAVASSLHALVPEAMPEVIPVAIPAATGSSWSCRWTPTPSRTRWWSAARCCSGSPATGARRPAPGPRPRRQRPGRPGRRARQDERRTPPWRRAWQPTDIALWPKDVDGKESRLRPGVLRVAGGLDLPRRVRPAVAGPGSAPGSAGRPQQQPPPVQPLLVPDHVRLSRKYGGNQPPQPQRIRISTGRA